MRRVARLRDLAAAVLAAVFILSTVAPSFAAGGQSGSLQGTIVSGATNQPLGDVQITAVSPTGRYTAKTDARGQFQIIGMNVDTYTVSFSLGGYQTGALSGVSIQGDQTQNIGTETLQKATTTIGRTVGRSASSVFQPSQTTDTYTISGERILQTTGKVAATDETQLALAVPGVSLTDTGAITIRGGLRTEVGYQLDGVPFTEPFFAMNGGNNLFNGIGSLQVVEGAGDATQADVGSGVFNLIPKRGTYPGFGYFDAEIGSPNLRNQLAFEYGLASKSGNISNYIAYTAYNSDPYLGYRNSDAASYGNYYAVSREKSQQFLDNFVFKFGKDLNQSLQVLYVNTDLEQYGNYGGFGNTQFYYNDPNNAVANLWNSTPGANYQQQVGLNPGAPSRTAVPTGPEEIGYNPTRFLKVEYDNNIDSATFLRLRYWNWETLQGDANNQGSNYLFGLGLGSYPTQNETGGPRVGGSLDFQHQFGANLTVSLEGTYETVHPVWNGYDPNAIMFLLAAGAGGPGGPSEADFLPGGYLSTAMCGATLCFPNGPPAVPTTGINYNAAWYQQYGGGIRVQYNLKKLKLDLGVRKDYQIQNYGINPFDPGFVNNPSDVNPASLAGQYLKPSELQPRGAISYQFGNDDAVRAAYGRSAVFLTAQTAGTPAGMYGAGPFLNVPAQPGSLCGSGAPNATPPLPCQNYAQQLYWLYDQNFDAPDYGGALPALYSNYDFTYQHQFKGGYALKITPFYKNGTDLPSFALVRSLAANSFVFVVNNTAINKTSGVELGFNTPDRQVGFSGFLSATYQNVIGSTPPLGSGEDSLPINGSGSLILGDTYRAGYVSPVVVRIGGDYKFKDGFRIGGTLQFNNGYPYSVGSTIPSSCPVTSAGTFANIQQANFGCGITPIPGFEEQVGTNLSTQYYDPAYSGSNTNANIAATRGTPATSSSGGVLWHPNLDATLGLEYKTGHNVVGVQITNLFGNWYNGLTPTPNPYYQPISNGVSGPLTGTNPYVGIPGFVNEPRDQYAFSNGAYIYAPTLASNSTPGNVLNFYYQYQF